MRFILCLAVFISPIIAQDKNTTDNRFSTYYYQKRTLFELLPNDSGEIIFVGNSITDGCEWSELFKNPLIKNRGISGDITDGVLDRLNEITESIPVKIFLMIGVNDLAKGKSVASIIHNYRMILDKIHQDSPETQLFVQSVLPVNAAYPKFKNHVNKTDSIIVLNKRVSELATEYGLTYIDLYEAFTGEDGQMDPTYSNDGLHLTGSGYILWKQLINPFLVTKR